MFTTVEPLQQKPTVPGEVPELSDARVLEDKTPEWLRTPSVSALFVLLLGILMVTLFGSRPLWPTDLWDHVNYGTWILENRSVAATEPLMPLAEGVPLVNTVWLAQVGLA